MKLVRMWVGLGLGLATVGAACGGDSAEPVTIQFAAEQELLGSFQQDTGFVPAASPAAIRVIASANAQLVALAEATATGDELTPIAGSGSLALDAGFSLEVSAKVDAAGVQFEGVVETFEYAVDPSSQTFDPFVLGETATLSSAFPPGELAQVPIPSVPGATLIVAVGGGALNTNFSGVCATAAGGVAQYTAEAVIDGTLDVNGTIEIEIPIVGTESFGPFPVSVPIPATTVAVDLGSYSTVDASPVGVGPCDGGMGDTDASPTTTSNSDSSGDNSATATQPMTDAATDTNGAETDSNGTGGTETDGPTASDSTGVPPVENTDDLCSDAADNDGDGDIDCDDSDCARTAVCRPCGSDKDCPQDFVCLARSCTPGL